MSFEATPRSRSRSSVPAIPGFERVVEDQQAQEGHPRLVVLVIPVSTAELPARHAQGAQALAAELGEEPLDLRAHARQRHDAPGLALGRRADLQHAGQGPLGHQQVPSAPATRTLRRLRTKS